MNDKKIKKIRAKYQNKKVLHRDKTVFKVLSKTHYLTKNQLETLNFSEPSLNRYLETGTLELKEVFVEGKFIELYRVSDYGKEWLRSKEVFNENINFYNSTGIEHDMKIGEVLVSLLSNNFINSVDDFRSEYDLRDEFKNYIEELRENGQDERADQLEEQREQGLISVPDYSYKVGSEIYIEEIITNSGAYTEAHLEAKQNYSNIMGYGQVQYIKI